MKIYTSSFFPSKIESSLANKTENSFYFISIELKKVKNEENTFVFYSGQFQLMEK